MAFKTQKLDRNWELKAVVLEKFSGVGANGESYFRVKVGGFTFFNEDLYNTVNEGDHVIVSGEYMSDRYSKKTGGYTPQFELNGALVVEGAFVDAGYADPSYTNGNGKSHVSKGQPA